jgi:outer membrane protein assembly factor BamB
LSGEGNNLNAYATESPFVKQNVIRNASDDPEGLDINAQICFFPDGSRRFIAGEDTGQPDPPAGWGIFELRGRRVGRLSARQVGKLTPTYQTDGPENYGCGFLSDGRVVTSDVGEQQEGEGNGQLIVWFPPFDEFTVRYCKIDVGIATAGQIHVDDQDRVYVMSGRGPNAGVLRYSGPFPTSDDASGGCGRRDATGAPLADAVEREQFIGSDQLGFGAVGIVASPAGGFYVSSIAVGAILEFDAAGRFLRRVLDPPAGEGLGTFTYGTPFGLAVDAEGTLYYADLDLVVDAGGIGPGPDGKVWRIRFVEGAPQPPELIDRGLDFPDGLGILEHRRLRPPQPAGTESLTYAYGPERTFFNGAERFLTPETAAGLRERWRFQTGAIVTGSPAVAEVDVPGEGRIRVVYFVSWDGFVYAVRFDDGSELWRFAWDQQPGAGYPGAASAHVAEIGGRQRVLVGAGESFYSLDAATGKRRWRFVAGTGCVDEDGRPPGHCGFDGERNEILSSAIVADGKAYFGMDVNEGPTGKGGFYAVDIRTGTLEWYFDVSTGATCTPKRSDRVRRFDGYHSARELGLPANFFATRRGCDFDRSPNGCGDVWSSAALDRERRALYFGTSNCETSTEPGSPRPRPPMPPYDEALVSLDLDGRPLWRWRPREVDNEDLAFGAVPNLFSIDVDGEQREVVGIGNKDGTYYVVDRDGVNARSGVRWDDADPSSLPYWRRKVVPGGAIGGIIATAAVDEGSRRVFFSTGPGTDVFAPQQPTVHALDLDTGEVVWQNTAPPGRTTDASYAPTTAVPGLVIVGSALAPHVRVFDAVDGTLLWDESIGDPTTLGGVGSGAVVIDGTLLVGSGLGFLSRDPQDISNVSANAPSSLVALCAPFAPGCP